jgi:hypothetical protein
MSGPEQPAVLEELRRLKYRYLTALDTKQWDDFADTLTADVTAEYGERLSFTGRDQVVDYMSGTLGPGILTAHLCHHPDLEPDAGPGTASGRWTLEDTVIVPEFRFLLRGASIYTDRYRREADGRWRIAATGYRRLYEYTISLDDLPSFKLTAGG